MYAGTMGTVLALCLAPCCNMPMLCCSCWATFSQQSCFGRQACWVGQKVVKELGSGCAAWQFTSGAVTLSFGTVVRVQQVGQWAQSVSLLLCQQLQTQACPGDLMGKDVCSRKTLIYLILTLNHIYPDYDFSQLRAHHFRKEASIAVAEQAIDSHLLEVSRVSEAVVVPASSQPHAQVTCIAQAVCMADTGI